MREKDFQRQVIDTARALGWMVAAFRPALSASGHWLTAVQADGKGYPDLTAVRPPRVLFIELKNDNGRLTPEQVIWLGHLKDCPGVETFIWRPSDAEEIIKVLSKGGER